MDKFPLVGWTRDWYAENTENNYDEMISGLNTTNSISKESKNSKMYMI